MSGKAIRRVIKTAAHHIEDRRNKKYQAKPPVATKPKKEQ